MTREATAEAAARRAKARFGHKGHFIIDDAVGLFVGGFGGPFGGLGSLGGVGTYVTGVFTVGTVSGESGGLRSSHSTVGLRPSVDYFVADGLSLGGSVGAAFSHSKYDQMTDSPYPVGHPEDRGPLKVESQYNHLSVSVEPRVGTVIPLTDSLSLWPRVGAGYQRFWSGDSGYLASYQTVSAFTRLGLVVNAGRHLFLDLGPELRLSYSSDAGPHMPESKATALNLGVRGGLGLAF